MSESPVASSFRSLRRRAKRTRSGRSSGGQLRIPRTVSTPKQEIPAEMERRMTAKERFLAAAARSSKTPDPPSFGHMAPPRRRRSTLARRHERFVSGVQVRLKELADFKLGQRVAVKKYGQGSIGFLGCVHYATGLRVGVVLDDAKGTHDGFVRGNRYFHAPDKCGIIVKPDQIEFMFSADGTATPTTGSVDLMSGSDLKDLLPSLLAVEIAEMSEEESLGHSGSSSNSSDDDGTMETSGLSFPGSISRGLKTIKEPSESKIDSTPKTIEPKTKASAQSASEERNSFLKRASKSVSVAPPKKHKGKLKLRGYGRFEGVDIEEVMAKEARRRRELEFLNRVGAPYLYDSKLKNLSSVEKERMVKADLIKYKHALKQARLTQDDLTVRLTFARDNVETSLAFQKSLEEHAKLVDVLHHSGHPSLAGEPSQELADILAGGMDEHLMMDEHSNDNSSDSSSSSEDDGMSFGGAMVFKDGAVKKSKKEEDQRKSRKAKRKRIKLERVKTEELLFQRNEQELMAQFEKLLDLDGEMKNIQREISSIEAETAMLTDEGDTYSQSLFYGSCAKDEMVDYLFRQMKEELALLRESKTELKRENDQSLREWVLRGSKGYLQSRCTVSRDWRFARKHRQTIGSMIESRDDSSSTEIDSSSAGSMDLNLPF